MSFNLLNDRSAEATVTGSVRKIRKAVVMFGKIDLRCMALILLKKSNGFTIEMPKFES